MSGGGGGNHLRPGIDFIKLSLELCDFVRQPCLFALIGGIFIVQGFFCGLVFRNFVLDRLRVLGGSVGGDLQHRGFQFIRSGIERGSSL